MNVTVAVCTWNRAQLLDKTLARMLMLRIPPGVEWELLVVNNNSTDDTDAVLAKHVKRLPLRRLFESKQGHSHARNCAIDAAKGELLIWTDDDVLVDQNWLAEYVRAAEAWPDASYFGGTIEPWFEDQPPQWIKQNLRELEGPFALRSFGKEVRPLANDELPFGASVAFRTAVQREYRYNVRLGRMMNVLTSGDETDVLRRMQRDGLAGVWVGTAQLRHFVPRERMRLRYIREFFEGLGRSQWRTENHSPVATLFGAPRWLLRWYVKLRAIELYRQWTGSADWIPSLHQASVVRGRVIESRLQRQAESSQRRVASTTST